MPSISALYVYPVKSCGGIAVSEVRLLPTGLEYDRNWMVTNPAGRMLTQRSHARLALVEVALDEHDLILSAPGMAALRTPLAIESTASMQNVTVSIWDDTVQAFDTGPEAAGWFSSFLGEAARLVRFDPSVPRPADARWTGGIAATAQFSDGFPLLVIGESSLDDLNTRLTGKGAPSIPMNRFRPNLVIGGLDAYEEDYVEQVTIQAWDGIEAARATSGERAVQLNLIKPCARCPIPTIDQATGAPHADWPNEPLDTMATYRGNARLDGALTFGQNAIVAAGEGAVLALGQTVDAELSFGD
ncbi:MOSC domain-containing protein [Paraburkholderia sp. DHOC27]|uniref:MOSC domain-containing protein n=1 Tax=Paraburkholderia sp. DHOC27 TaxID=2303330 RepID=UPI000E3D7D7A|nr:MOSC N-terminal beta barrel domain-containing protein [Paraburkholderia sp. DHOC27]RFU47694.1 MOSC domain-containing protein [Paraburkholderia sp. DHOC27]